METQYTHTHTQTHANSITFAYGNSSNWNCIYVMHLRQNLGWFSHMSKRSHLMDEGCITEVEKKFMSRTTGGTSLDHKRL
jgi:hypothetical protein